MSGFNWFDYIVLVIFFLSIMMGFTRGFVKEMVSLLTLIAAFVVASMFSNQLAASFTSSPGVQSAVSQASSTIGVNTAQPISYVAIGICFALLFAATIIVGSIINLFLSFAFQTGILGLGNRILGGVFGLVRGFLLNLVIIFVLQLTPIGAQAWWHQSQFVIFYQPSVQWLGSIVSPSLANLKEKFNEKLGQTLQNVNSQFKNITNTIP